MVPVEEEDALAVAVEEEAALAVPVEEEGTVVVLVTVEEEGAVVVDVELVAAVEEECAVVAWVAAEVWYGAPKSSMRRLLVRLLADMVQGNFLLPGMFSKKLCKKLWRKTFNTTGALTSTMQATKMQRARSFYTLVRKTGLKPVLTGTMSDFQVTGGVFLSGVGERRVRDIPLMIRNKKK